MAETRTGLFRRNGKCTGKPHRMSYIRPELVFRGTEEDSAQNPNEISAFSPELVFRQIPGKLVQRRRHAQRFGRRIGCNRALLDPVSGRVLPVPHPPARLRLTAPRCLTFWLAAGPLSRSDSRVRSKPPPANRARSLPGLWHGDPSWSPCGGQCSAGVQIRTGGSLLASRRGSFFASAEASKQTNTATDAHQHPTQKFGVQPISLPLGIRPYNEDLRALGISVAEDDGFLAIARGVGVFFSGQS